MNGERITIDDRARAALVRAGAPGELFHEIERGDVVLYRFRRGTDRETYLATEASGGTVWVHAMSGRDMEPIIRALFRSATRQGFRAVSCWTRRPSLARYLRRHGFFSCGWSDGWALCTRINATW